MKLNKIERQLIDMANEAYPDDLIELYVCGDGEDGDTLAEFIVNEIRSVVDEKMDAETAAAVVGHSLRVAMLDLKRVAEALEHISNESNERPARNPARRPMKVLSVSEWTQKVLKVLAERADQPTRNSARECLKRLQAGLPPAREAYGGFLREVLAGDVEGAFYKADLHNGQIITRAGLWDGLDGHSRFYGR